MAFRWVASGAPEAEGLLQEFPTRADAEAWLTESYENLIDAGVDEVTLMQDDHVVYGPMSVHP